MEMTGIEPVSENLSVKTSSIIAYYLHSLSQSTVGNLVALVAS